MTTKTLAELRALSTPTLPTRTIRLCLNLDLLAQVQALANEKADLGIERTRLGGSAEDEQVAEEKQRVRKAGQSGNAGRLREIADRLAEIADEQEALYDQMREYEGDLLLRGIDGGRWQAFKDDNPARDGNETDDRIGYGMVNASALRESLGDWMAAWNGEEFDGDRGWFLKLVASGDQQAIVSEILQMQEGRVVVPKATGRSSSTTSAESGDDSPAP